MSKRQKSNRPKNASTFASTPIGLRELLDASPDAIFCCDVQGRWNWLSSAIESFTGAPFGSPGTETAAAIITRAVKDVPVKQTGYSGLMIPVLEERVLTRRWTERTYGLDSILAYSAVCAGGVDTVPLPGDTSEAAIAGIVGDVATLAFKWNKPLAARLLPAPGKKAGDMTEFSGALANAIIQPLPGTAR